jgi:hypothetical protein
MVQLVFLAGLFALAARAGGGSKTGQLFTLGVIQLVKGKTYHFVTTVTGFERLNDPGAVAAGMVSALQISGATDVIASPAAPMQLSYTMRAVTTKALSVGAPYPLDSMGIPFSIVVNSVQEVPNQLRA